MASQCLQARVASECGVYFGCLRVNIWSRLGLFQICRDKCLYSQWKEVGREERGGGGGERDKAKRNHGM